MPPWGRPPQGRRERERWERYQQQYLYDEQRVQELESEDDSHGVPASVFKHSNRSISDELFFNDGASRYPRTHSDEHLAYGDRYDSEDEESDEDEEDTRRSSTSLVRRDSDQIIARRALDRIDRAKQKGQASVNLTHEEIEALEKRYSRPGDSPERERKSSADKGKRRGSPSSSNGAWTRKKGSRRASLIAPTTALAPAKQRTKGGKKQFPPDEAYGAGVMPPGFITTGPGGVPVYAPLGYYPAQPPARRTVSDTNRYSPPRSGDSSRSTSASSRRGQPYANPPYAYAGHPDARPHSSRGPPSPTDSEYWQPYAQYQSYPSPGQAGRRVSSVPSDVAYSNVYRRPVPPASARGRMQPSTSDPSLLYPERGPSGLGNEYEPSSATSEDEEDSEDELANSRETLQERREPVPAPASRARRRR